MKKSGAVSIAALIALALFPANAFSKDDNAGQETAATVAPKRTAADEQKITEERKRTQDARKDLNGSSWEVQFKSQDPKIKDVKDKFTFQDGMFKSDHYIGDGYTPTNYSITMSGEGTERAVWETMLSAKEGQIFIRGEWEKDKMSGNITEQLDGGKKVVERYFTTEARKAIPVESKAKDEAANSGAKVQESATTEEESSALVSKEEAPSAVPAFVPGTTDENR